MIIYHTTFHVDQDIEQECIEYLKAYFIPDSIQSGSLSHPRLQRVLTTDSEGISLSIQFKVANEALLQSWLKKEGVDIQQKMFTKFGHKVVGFSTLLEEMDL